MQQTPRQSQNLSQRNVERARDYRDRLFGLGSRVAPHFHRAEAYIEARLGYVAALFNLLLMLAGTPSEDRILPTLAQFAL